MPGIPTMLEAPREIPIIQDADVCVVGGSCTGVFAAVRAARLGATVTLVEKQNAFGGVATSGLVNVWHSLLDTEYGQQIISGLTEEVVERLETRNAVQRHGENLGRSFTLNTEELKIELDELVLENRVTPFLHTVYVAPLCLDGALRAVVVESKSGRCAIAARVFIDATGDGDLAAHLGIPYRLGDALQPPTTCAKIQGIVRADFRLQELVREHRAEFGLRADQGWHGSLPDSADVHMLAETHVFGTDATDVRSLTAAEIEGRRQVRAMMDIIRKHGPQDTKLSLLSLASAIGVRESRHCECAYRLTESDVLSGKRFGDAIANGSYRVDIHDAEDGSFVFRYLDGRETRHADGRREEGRWRDPVPADPTFYQIPYRSMVSPDVDNLIVAGRALDADRGAFGAVRVMVNLNQTGEAAGAAAYLALDSARPVHGIDAAKLRDLLAHGGSIVL